MDLRRRGVSAAWQNLISHCQDGAKLQVAAVIFSLREEESERARGRERERLGIKAAVSMGGARLK